MESGATAFYMPGSIDGTRPGTFQLNGSDLANRFECNFECNLLLIFAHQLNACYFFLCILEMLNKTIAFKHYQFLGQEIILIN